MTAECARVLKPSGSMFVNLGDKFSDRAGPSWAGSSDRLTGRPEKPRRASSTSMAPRKSLLLLPERYRIRCVDELGLVARSVLVWAKPNGMPESVTDRVRRTHEEWVHLTLGPRYYSAIDHIREPYLEPAHRHNPAHPSWARRGKSPSTNVPDDWTGNPLGKLPGSVWSIATEPLKIPEHVAHRRCCDGRPRDDCADGVDHYAAFPTEWPKRIIQGWSPAGVCVECGEGRRPVVASVGLDMSRPQARRAQELADRAGLTEEHFKALLSVGVSDTGRGAATQSGTGKNAPEVYALADEAREALGGYAREYLLRRPTGFSYACACHAPSAPTRPAVVLDPFGGTGTTAMVAKALGRHGISVDMSADYCRLAQWRTNDRNQLAKVLGVEKLEQQPAEQGDIFDLLEATS